MKLSVTDEFLWDVYTSLDKTGDILGFILSGKRAIYYRGRGLQNPIFKKYEKEKGKRAFTQLLYYLKKRNYIKAKNLENKEGIIITKEGLGRVLKASFKMEKNRKRKDGKWIMLIFDIPQKYKKSRNLLTSMLHNLEYKMLQQSVWTTPYDVLDKTEKLLQYHSLDDFVKIFVIQEI